MSSIKKKNSPRTSDTPDRWPRAVWALLRKRLVENKNSKGETYYSEVPTIDDAEAPPAILAEMCHPATKSTRITVCYNSVEYSLAIHRARFMLQEQEKTGVLPSTGVQASHLCPDSTNIDGRGTFHCTNPLHIVAEDDKTNKGRQRCLGWVWIHPHDGHKGDYWYPTCVHDPPCIRYREKDILPLQLNQ